MRTWNNEDVSHAIDVLGKSASVGDAQVTLGVTGPSLRAAFQRARERGLKCGAPGDHVGTAPPRPVSAVAGAGIERLATNAGEAADRVYLRKLEREVGRRDYLGEKLKESLFGAFNANPIKLSSSTFKVRREAGRRMITVMLSDIHFGLHVNPREVPGGGYDWQIAARRVAKLATEVAAWKPQHRDETDLHVVINGDVIAGLIHLDDSGVRKLTEQIHGATVILIAFLDYLSKHFSKLTVSATPGNHDRVSELRTFSQRWDSHAHAIYLAIQQAFRTDPRITFNIPMTGEATIDLPGGKSIALYTHGDVAPTVANVGKALNLKPMIASLNRLNASGEYKKPVRVFAVGHWHSPFMLDTGIGAILVNGSVIGPDSYARNACAIRGSEGRPCQVMFESVPGYEFGDCRFVRLNDADTDATFDKVIATPSIERWLS